jgi:DtxR family Mn-dependent transcriptional regulator
MELRKQKLSESLEDYLETILELETTHRVARAKDIAEKMGVLRGSVTGALRALADKGLINYAPYSFITLTDRGRKIAAEVRRRHTVIRDFLHRVLLLEPMRAEENACRIEHAIDRTAVDRLVQFIEYIHYCPRTGKDWIEAFVNYYSHKEVDRDDCRKCLDSCVKRLEHDSG